jgi:signal transduction histidine kinase
MHYYFTTVSLIAGICLGFGILYLFIGLRRKENKPLNISFALFALCYAATLFNGIRWYTVATAADYIAINRFDAVFVTMAYVGLIWFISFYTGTRPRIFLWVLSATLIVPSLVFIISPAAFTGDVSGLVYISLPWGEKLANLDSVGSVWLDILLLARLVTLGYIIFALIQQFRLGERQPAIILGLGMLPFIAGVFYEVLGESGIVPNIPFGELGFLGIAIAASLQMANSVIKTEEALEQHQHNLKGLVKERTVELEATQERLLAQAQENAVKAERNRLARDLHDEVTQTIYSASLVAQVLPQIWDRNPDEGKRNLVKLRQLVRGALGEMRTLLFELRPSALETADLETLLHQLGDTLTGRTRIPVELTVEGEDPPPVEVKIVLYRVAQEAFNNIAKHAEATRVDVHLQTRQNRVELKIRDFGRGFEIKSISSEHMGIRIMQERAETVGAQVEVESAPGTGTTVKVEWNQTNDDKGQRTDDQD